MLRQRRERWRRRRRRKRTPWANINHSYLRYSLSFSEQRKHPARNDDENDDEEKRKKRKKKSFLLVMWALRWSHCAGEIHHSPLPPDVALFLCSSFRQSTYEKKKQRDVIWLYCICPESTKIHNKFKENEKFARFNSEQQNKLSPKSKPRTTSESEWENKGRKILGIIHKRVCYPMKTMQCQRLGSRTMDIWNHRWTHLDTDKID